MKMNNISSEPTSQNKGLRLIEDAHVFLGIIVFILVFSKNFIPGLHDMAGITFALIEVSFLAAIAWAMKIPSSPTPRLLFVITAGLWFWLGTINVVTVIW